MQRGLGGFPHERLHQDIDRENTQSNLSDLGQGIESRNESLLYRVIEPLIVLFIELSRVNIKGDRF
ncbi:hypothetical protein [Moorena producens]|uniref:hypothetical protein n=1 Tax=Moorena producens TaxID=1155739 RepID=UPI000AF3F9F5|nr:hypothetical protein [Moorena producens]